MGDALKKTKPSGAGKRKGKMHLELQDDRSASVSMPKRWLSKILAEVGSYGELKVILYIYLLTYGRNVNFCSITTSEFMSGITDEAGEILYRGLGIARQHIIRGLSQAEEHGHILVHRSSLGGRQRKWYFLNTPDNRSFHEALQKGQITVEELWENQRQNAFLHRLGLSLNWNES